MNLKTLLEKEKMLVTSIKLFPKRQTLDSSKLKEFADDNFKFFENRRTFSEYGRTHCGKRRNCSLRAISPFPTVFSKTCTTDT